MFCFEEGYSVLEMDFHRGGGEGAEGRLRVLQVVHGGIPVVLVVHRTKFRIGIKHGLLDLHTWILDERGRDAEPLLPVIGADGDLGVGGDLSGDGFHVAGLDVQFPVDDFGSAEGTDLWLVAVDRSEEIGSCLF